MDASNGEEVRVDASNSKTLVAKTSLNRVGASNGEDMRVHASNSQDPTKPTLVDLVGSWLLLASPRRVTDHG